MIGSFAVLVLPLLLLLPPHIGAFLLPNETDCPTEALVDLTQLLDWGERDKTGPYHVDGVRYTSEAIQRHDDRVLGCPCKVTGCLPLCCDAMSCLSQINLTNEAKNFLPIYDAENFSHQLDAKEDRANRWHQFAWNPCHGKDGYELDHDEYLLLGNGSLYRTDYKSVTNYTEFCVRYFNESFSVMTCFEEADLYEDVVKLIFSVMMMISVPFFIATLAVYIFILELRNLHGQTLCAYISSLIVAYTALSTSQIMKHYIISDFTCNCIAYTVHFSFLASFFWLNVMCFDIWWTFSGFRSLHGSVKQRERKKFIMYSIYAWSSASILTIICIIMDMVPGLPTYIIRPKFGSGRCWFGSRAARAIYFYGPMGVTLLCNICLFVLTALKIMRHKKDTARQLKGSESRRHDDNKQWFNLYLKLFIVMGIIWSMEIVSWIFENDGPYKYIFYITDLANTLHGVIIFVIFVCKSKVKRLLMKRFSCRGINIFSCSSTNRSRCTMTSSTSRTTCVTAIPLQEKVNPYAESQSRSKPSVNDDSNYI